MAPSIRCTRRVALFVQSFVYFFCSFSLYFIHVLFILLFVCFNFYKTFCTLRQKKKQKKNPSSSNTDQRTVCIDWTQQFSGFLELKWCAKICIVCLTFYLMCKTKKEGKSQFECKKDCQKRLRCFLFGSLVVLVDFGRFLL